MRKDAAFEVFAKRLADVGTWRMVIALAVELAATGQVKPCLEMLGHCAVQQGVLGVTRVVAGAIGGHVVEYVRQRACPAQLAGPAEIPMDYFTRAVESVLL